MAARCATAPRSADSPRHHRFRPPSLLSRPAALAKQSNWARNTEHGSTSTSDPRIESAWHDCLTGRHVLESNPQQQHHRDCRLHMPFERVYTVHDYYDGPRSGVADYLGRPHHYSCEWDDGADDYAETFALVEIDDCTVSLVLQQWEIWRRWEYAFHRQEVPQATHPGLPGNDLHYAELQTAIKSRIANTLAKPVRARGVFRVDPNRPETPRGVMRELQVEWELLG
jgi:hypothetical protein